MQQTETNTFTESQTAVSHSNDTSPDEQMTTFVYGNVKIVDLDTDEILVNLRF
jgi:hypothetical protein